MGLFRIGITLLDGLGAHIGDMALVLDGFAEQVICAVEAVKHSQNTIALVKPERELPFAKFKPLYTQLLKSQFDIS